ncbi:MAG: penicillin-insensitive murein endopeptidase [Myxococcota bacterium]
MATPAHAQMYGGRPAAEWEPLEGGLQRFSVEVRPGMSIETIAYRYKVTPDAIRQWNALEPGAAAEVGRHVLLHVPPEALPPEHRRLTHIVAPGDSWMSIARQYGVRLGDLVSWNWRMDVDDLHHGDALFIYQPPGGEGLINRPLTLNHQLTSGPGFVVRNPHRSWGSRTMVALLRKTLTATHTDFPERSPIQVGDISHRGGGFFPPHISHRNGRDADVGYYILNDPSTARRMVAATPKTIDAERVWSLFKRLIRSGQLRGILVDVALQKVIYEEAQRQGEPETELRRIFQYPHRGPALITHWPGHDDHFHLMVR